ncbi:MAG: globin [Acidobacteriaceae bacterium]|nr:globin [Acidobacteriaceae bacterium]
MEESEVYSVIGEEGFRKLIGAFYSQVPDDEVLAPMYDAGDFAGAEQRLRDFLIFRFGGPQRYVEERGHPRLRMRHAPFPVTELAREHWMKMMNHALDTTGIPDKAKQLLRAYFESTAAAMINRA